jgi:hypothetical protein
MSSAANHPSEIISLRYFAIRLSSLMVAT